MGWAKYEEDNYEMYTERTDSGFGSKNYYECESYKSQYIANYDSLFRISTYSDYTRRSITGIKVGSNKCVGYCKYCEHPGYLTAEQRKIHNCIKKECHYYVSKKHSLSNAKNAVSNPWSQLERLSFSCSL